MLAQPQTQAHWFSRLCATSAVPSDTFGLNCDGCCLESTALLGVIAASGSGAHLKEDGLQGVLSGFS